MTDLVVYGERGQVEEAGWAQTDGVDRRVEVTLSEQWDLKRWRWRRLIKHLRWNESPDS